MPSRRALLGGRSVVPPPPLSRVVLRTPSQRSCVVRPKNSRAYPRTLNTRDRAQGHVLRMIPRVVRRVRVVRTNAPARRELETARKGSKRPSADRQTPSSTAGDSLDHPFNLTVFRDDLTNDRWLDAERPRWLLVRALAHGYVQVDTEGVPLLRARVFPLKAPPARACPAAAAERRPLVDAAAVAIELFHFSTGTESLEVRVEHLGVPRQPPQALYVSHRLVCTSSKCGKVSSPSL